VPATVRGAQKAARPTVADQELRLKPLMEHFVRFTADLVEEEIADLRRRRRQLTPAQDRAVQGAVKKMVKALSRWSTSTSRKQ
jgi:hypothetical protein